MWWLSLVACVLGQASELKVFDAVADGERATLEPMVRQLAQPALDGRAPGSEGSRRAREYIVAQLKACGVAPAGDKGFEQAITTGVGTNVLGRIEGSGEHTLIVSAHYDHQDGGMRTHPGAQDNAAAVTALLHLACALAAEPVAMDVVVAFWDAEEPPTFLTEAMGSRYWHAHPTVDLEAVKAVVVLDLIGGGLWDGHRDTFAFGVETSPELTRAVAATTMADERRLIPASLSLIEDMVVGRKMVWSDYEVFRRHDTPVLFLSDGQNRRYHTPQDTADALDLDKLVAESQMLTRLTRAIAAGPVPTWKPSPRRKQDVETVRQLLDVAIAAESTKAWGETARASIVDARRTLEGVKGRSAADDQTLRRAAQRLMCWAGSSASSFTCGML